MKRGILELFAVLSLVPGALAQGLVFWDCTLNTDPSPAATSHGQWWIQSGDTTALLDQDVNATLWASATGVPGSFTPLETLLLSGPQNGVGDIRFMGSGEFLDLSGVAYRVPGHPTYMAYFFIQAWLGAATTYADAGNVPKYDGSVGGVFENRVTGSPIEPAPFLTMNPAIVLSSSSTVSPIPEPGVMTMLGAAWLTRLLNRWRLSKR